MVLCYFTRIAYIKPLPITSLLSLLKITYPRSIFSFFFYLQFVFFPFSLSLLSLRIPNILEKSLSYGFHGIDSVAHGPVSWQKGKWFKLPGPILSLTLFLHFHHIIYRNRMKYWPYCCCSWIYWQLTWRQWPSMLPEPTGLAVKGTSIIKLFALWN